MVVSKNILLKSLLCQNYFPMQKEDKEQLPPIFTSSDLTKSIAEEIHNDSIHTDRRKIGFDSIHYYVTRHNQVSRLFCIPHPKPYINLCFEIYNNWDKIKRICSNTNSIIYPQKHRDGRIIIMNYETPPIKRDRYYKVAFGKKLLVHTDISNCYPSLYSHVIPWALVGIQRAKKDKYDNSLWFNKIDIFSRACCRNETAGVPIGPATSNIVCEIILERVDRVLRQRGYTYTRFIDDYYAYCKTQTEAEEFIRDLNMELIKYRFNLNITKTKLTNLPQPIEEEWINKIRGIIPADEQLNPGQVSDILDSALMLQKDNPDGSILKYASKSIVNKLNNESSIEFVKYIIELSFHYPILISLLYKPLQNIYSQGTGNFQDKFLFLLDDSIKYRRSESMAWLLYYLKLFHSDISSETAKNIIECGDCMAITILAEFTNCRRIVINFANRIDKTELYDLDKYWILLYQLYLKGKISNPYISDATFDILKTHGVSFVQL